MLEIQKVLTSEETQLFIDACCQIEPSFAFLSSSRLYADINFNFLYAHNRNILVVILYSNVGNYELFNFLSYLYGQYLDYKIINDKDNEILKPISNLVLYYSSVGGDIHSLSLFYKDLL